MPEAIGIDLGTTFSVVAVYDGERAEVIADAAGERLMPSVVAVNARGRMLVGSPARAQAAGNPTNTVFSIKRRMGTAYRVSLAGREMTPQEVSACILKSIKTRAAARLGKEISHAIITVPAYFTHTQRRATLEAGRLAGLEVLRIINEPTAAALAYGLDREDVQTILVWDLGGGTFDVSILELGDGLFEVKAVNGNSHLGGDDWDEVLLMLLAERFRRETGCDVLADPRLRRRTLDAAEKAKRDLSDHAEASVLLSVASHEAGMDRDLRTRVTRTEFEAATRHLLERVIEPTRQALKDARLEVDQIDRVVLVGGSTRMPAVRALVRQMFRQEPYTRINPDEVVAIGAAVQAGMLSGLPRRAILVDVIPLSLGIKTEGGLFSPIIRRNRTIPCSSSQLFTNAADGQQSMHVEVLQGEREIAADNVSLGTLNLSDIAALPRGHARVEVTFFVDVDGVVRVEAEDLRTENRSSIEIHSDALLGDAELDARLKEAEALYAEDMRRRREIEARIRAQNALRESAAMLEGIDANNGDLPVERVAEIQESRAMLRAVLAADDVECLAAATSDVAAAMQQTGGMQGGARQLKHRETVRTEPSAQDALHQASQTLDARSG